MVKTHAFRRVAAIGGAVLLLTLAGCATVDPVQQCSATDWHKTGLNEALKGRGSQYAQDRFTRCEAAGVRGTQQAWQSGWQQGHQEFCSSPARAVEFARQGGRYTLGHCPAAAEAEFLRHYQPAAEQRAHEQTMRQLQQRLDSRQNARNNVVRELARSDRQTADHQRRLLAEKRIIDNDIRNIERQMQMQMQLLNRVIR